MSMTQEQTIGKLAIILLAGAALRACLLWWIGDLPPRISDEHDYVTLAQNLSEQGRFALTQSELTSLRPPLYPVFMAGLYALFGQGNLWAVRIAQAGIGLLTALIAHDLGRRLYSDRAGLWAAALTCLYPSLAVFNNLILTETLFTFLLCAACLLLVKVMERLHPVEVDAERLTPRLPVRADGGAERPSLSGDKRVGRTLALYGAAGMALGLATLTRSVLWVFPIVLSPYLLAAAQQSWRSRVAGVACLWLAFGAVLAPWAVRNTRLQRTLTTVDVMGGRNLMMGNYEHTPMWRAWDAISVQGEQAWDYMLRNKYPPQETLTQGQLDKQALRYGVEYVKANPGLTLRRDVVKFLQFWQLERELVAGASRGVFGPLSKPALLGVAATICGAYMLAMLAAVAGFFLVPAKVPAGKRLLMLVIAFVCGMHAVVFAHSRYHLPLMPLLLVFAGAAASRPGVVLAMDRGWRLWVAGLVSAVLVASWAYELAVIDWPQFAGALQATPI